MNFHLPFRYRTVTLVGQIPDQNKLISDRPTNNMISSVVVGRNSKSCFPPTKTCGTAVQDLCTLRGNTPKFMLVKALLVNLAHQHRCWLVDVHEERHAAVPTSVIPIVTTHRHDPSSRVIVTTHRHRHDPSTQLPTSSRVKQNERVSFLHLDSMFQNDA